MALGGPHLHTSVPSTSIRLPAWLRGQGFGGGVAVSALVVSAAAFAGTLVFPALWATPMTMWALLAVAFGATLCLLLRDWIRVRKVNRVCERQEGRRLVGQFLQRKLGGQGVLLSHVEIDGFAVDHVLIHRKGVFVIDTEVWERAEDSEGVISFDGKLLRKDSDVVTDSPVAKTMAAAEALRKRLQRETRFMVWVTPVLLFPGWRVDMLRGAMAKAWVYAPTDLPGRIAKCPDNLEGCDLRALVDIITGKAEPRPGYARAMSA